MNNNIYNKLLFLFSLFVLSISAKTKVSGIISQDTRWTKEKSPIIIEDDIVIAPKTTLTITAGTHIVISPASLEGIFLVPQLNRIDSVSISIQVEGALSCVGKKNNRIHFYPQKNNSDKWSWYGIVYKKAMDKFSELSYVDITGAYTGLTISKCSPLIKNCVIEYNHIGLQCNTSGNAQVINSIISRNFASGIITNNANPTFLNTIIAFNKNLGIWCDGVSTVNISHSCIYGNSDGNLLDCDPLLGVPSRMNKNKDSVDFAYNLISNPIFAGSIADSIAIERDIKLKTDKSKIRDTLLAKILYDTLSDSTAKLPRISTHLKYELSPYSPCINAGNPSNKYNDDNGSINDIGLYGGPEFFSKSK